MSTHAHRPAPAGHRDDTVGARVEQLYESHSALVRTVCRSLLRDPVEAEDAAQQTFLSAQRALLNGTSPRDAAAWLATIARHESLARVRARMREPLPVEPDERESGHDVHAAAVRRQEAGELRDALAGLPAQQREAILLREVRGLSYQEVADALAVTTSSVESLVFRARRSLQARLQGALAGLSPAGWAQPLRELFARVGAGGLVAPAAAKVAAVGVGTAVVTGGALVGPRVLEHRHTTSPTVKTARPSAHRSPDAAAPSTAAAAVWARPALSAPDVAATHPAAAAHAVSGDSGAGRSASDGRGSVDNPEREHSGTGTVPVAGTSGAGSGREGSDGGGAHEVKSGSGGDGSSGGSGQSADSGTGASDSSSGSLDSGSEGATVASSPGGTTDPSSGETTTTTAPSPGTTTTDSLPSPTKSDSGTPAG